MADLTLEQETYKDAKRERLAAEREARTVLPTADDERAKAAAKLGMLKAQLEALKIPNVQGGAKGAFIEGEGAGASGEELPPALPPQASTTQQILEKGTPLAGGMLGGMRGARMVAPLAAGATAVAGPGAGLAVTTAGAAAGAYAGAGGGSLTMEGAKRALNLPGAPDSFDEYFSQAAKEGSDAAWGEVWGQIGGIATSALSPYRRAVDPQSAALFEKQAVRLRSAYERLTGTSVDERAWYNPMRAFGRFSNQLDEAGTRRLIAQGMDPKAAQSVALSGGQIPSEIEETSFSKMWGFVSNSKSVINPDMHVYNQARTKLITEAALEDVGIGMNKLVPPEQVGEMVHGALNGHFDTLVAGRKLAANAIGMNVPSTARFSMAAVKKNMPVGTAGEELVNHMPDDLPWSSVQKLRENLGKMSQDGRLNDTQRGQVKWLAEQVDNEVVAGLPDFRMKRQYQEFTKHDDAINADGFNTAFIKGMLHEPASMRAYADKIMNKNDVGNFGKLERALKNAGGGPEIIANIRGNISERFLSGAVKDGVIQPSKVMLALSTEAKGSGKYFLTSTLGPEYAKNWHEYAKTMDTINEVARKSGHTLGIGRSILTLGTIGGAATAAYKGNLSVSDGLYLATAITAPVVVAKALTSRVQARILNKVANNVAKGINPKTTARLAMRLCEYADFGPEDFFKGQGILPSEQAADIAQRERISRGEMVAPTGGTPPPAM